MVDRAEQNAPASIERHTAPAHAAHPAVPMDAAEQLDVRGASTDMTKLVGGGSDATKLVGGGSEETHARTGAELMLPTARSLSGDEPGTSVCDRGSADVEVGAHGDAKSGNSTGAVPVPRPVLVPVPVPVPVRQRLVARRWCDGRGAVRHAAQ